MSAAEEVAQILLKVKAVTLRPKEPYRFTSGLLSPIYTDCRVLISYPKERARVIELMADLLDRKDLPDIIAGTATAGIPHAAWLAEKLDLPMIYARSKAKEHGKQAQIEGVLKPGQTVVVVEDLISTGGSSIETIETIRSNGGVADTILAIFNYELQQSATNLQQAKVELKALTNFTALVDAAIKSGDIESADREVVLAWQKDSKGWGKAHGFE